MVLGLEAPEEDLGAAFAIARRDAMSKGFAVGRTIFVEPAQRLVRGPIDDEEATRAMAESFARLCALWQRREAAPTRHIGERTLMKTDQTHRRAGDRSIPRARR